MDGMVICFNYLSCLVFVHYLYQIWVIDEILVDYSIRGEYFQVREIIDVVRVSLMIVSFNRNQ